MSTPTFRYTFTATGSAYGRVTKELYTFTEGDTVEAPAGEFRGPYVKATRVEPTEADPTAEAPEAKPKTTTKRRKAS